MPTDNRRRNLITVSSGGTSGDQAALAPQPAGNAPKPRTKRRRVKTKEPGIRVVDGSMDMLFFVVVVVLLIYGLVMMFSASYMEGLLNHGDGYMYVRTQGIAAIIGVLLMLFISFFDYHILMNTNVVFIGYFGMLAILTYTSFFGDDAHDARRWINIGPLSFQPSEAMKPVLIVFVAYLIIKLKDKNISMQKKVIPLLLAMLPVCLNMVLQRHISGLLIMCALFACVVFVSGMPWKDMLKLGAVVLVFAVVAAVAYSVARGGGLSYIFDRVASMESVESGEITDDNWQTAQSLIAIGSGGWFGLGFGESRQKYLWLPESQNDFIISIIVEELGYMGGLAVLILFGLLVYRGFRIASKAPDRFGMLITSVMTFQIGLQAILNIGVACNAFPNTGVSLPFFSSGGTALVIQLAEMGVVLAVSRRCENI